MPACEMGATRQPHAYVYRRRALACPSQGGRKLEGKQFVGRGDEEILVTAEVVEREMQVTERAEPILFGAGPVGEQAGGEVRWVRVQVALQGGMVAVVGDDGDAASTMPERARLSSR